MDISDYQKKASRTLIDKPDFVISDKDVMTSWCAIGLAGEAGEVLELIKKGIYHQQGIDIEKVKKELGDVTWYISGLCTVLGIKLADVLENNIEKLNIRYPDGYNSHDCKKRADAEKKRQK